MKLNQNQQIAQCICSALLGVVFSGEAVNDVIWGWRSNATACEELTAALHKLGVPSELCSDFYESEAAGENENVAEEWINDVLRSLK